MRLIFPDFFSPSISLFYNEKKKHSRLNSFILSILSILISIIIILVYFFQMIDRKKFTSYFYESFAKIPPEVKADKSGFFHYYVIKGIIPNDKYINVEGYENYYTTYMLGEDFNDHKTKYKYIYGKCTEQDMKDIEEIIEDKETFLTYGYCIQKLIRFSDKKIISVTDNEFIWPVIAEGRNLLYSLVITKCSTLPDPFTGEINSCASSEEIDNYLKSMDGGIIYFLEHYIDVGKYKNPIVSNFHSADINIQLELEYYVMYNIDYNPATLYSQNSLITNEKTKINTIFFSSNAGYDINKIPYTTEHILAIVLFWRSSRLQIYEREYDGLMDFLSNIGGSVQIIIRICSIISIFFSEYAELIDSKILFKDTAIKIKEKAKIKNNMIKNKEYNKLVLQNNIVSIKPINEKEGQVSSLNDLDVHQNIIKSKINNIKSINIEDGKNIGLLKFLYFLLLRDCFCINNKEVFKYLDIRTKILSEEFLYELYFEKYSENINKYNEMDESKENLIIRPDMENLKKLDILQNIKVNNS